MKDRLINNVDCAALLIKTLRDNPDLRIEQLLFILDEAQDYFNEEPDITLKRWTKKLENHVGTSKI